MSIKHPIIAITGSSGAGTSTVMQSFQHIFRRECLNAQIVEGDSFHRYDRMAMRAEMKAQEEAGNRNFSHFGPGANLLEELQDLFIAYGQNGTGKFRKYLHDAGEAEPFGQQPGTFTPWQEITATTDLMFYEGLHGAYADDKIDIAKQVDLCVGVVPTINLEWIQKLHRDQKMRGYSQEAVTDTILRRMPDYVSHLCPQFSRTHVNFQRVPIVDTSNPFIARDIPTADESMVVIRFANPKGIDFQYLINILHGAMMTRPNTLVVPGGKMGLAMQMIFTPMVLRLMDHKRRA
ncbi:phosphoribulokinase [Ferribacterium limneticum]|uniref:phosphoribulokinase n=1 Tax=Ferribacterium limneticum TaxID=76259 RepID=UPI001CFA94AE|nr:phosphoribulokinase [Ferribacterium limneticum]UCV27940.1 phosphoribulokinase [Ferribacterium limneticum]UCV31857.1 phosphoribulokinase [Ferribacterium limneticum]